MFLAARSMPRPCGSTFLKRLLRTAALMNRSDSSLAWAAAPRRIPSMLSFS